MKEDIPSDGSVGLSNMLRRGKFNRWEFVRHRETTHGEKCDNYTKIVSQPTSFCFGNIVYQLTIPMKCNLDK